MMTPRNRMLIAVAPLALLLAGCAETTFQDTLGIGKSAPDETRVRTVQPLSVPPDLDLRPPAENTRPATTAQATVDSAPGLSAPPGGAGAPAAPATSQRSTMPVAPASTESSFYDIYKKHGISLYKPDGTKKKVSELNRELAEKLKEEKRRKNPRYGTIFNIDSLWKD